MSTTSATKLVFSKSKLVVAIRAGDCSSDTATRSMSLARDILVPCPKTPQESV
jgi:hypothetical protein